MNHKQYLEAEGLSSTALKKFLKSPAHYKYASLFPQEETSAQALGTLCHLAVLEPHLLDKVKIEPDVDLRTRQGKDTMLTFKASLKADELSCSQEDYTTSERVARSVREHSIVRSLFKDAQFERAGFWVERGVKCKFKADCITASGALVDLKTTINADERFKYDIIKFGYATSLAFYGLGLAATTGIHPTGYYIVAAEKNGPYGVNVFDISDTIVSEQANILNALDKFNRCMQSDKWPGYDETIIKVTNNNINF